MKKIVELFIIPEFKKVHLTKDVGLVPYYLAKNYNLDAEIVYTNKIKEELPPKFRTINLKELPYIKVNKFINKIDKFKVLENWNFLKYLFKNSKDIDILILFHFNKKKIPIFLLYKYLNKNGKIYMKMDIEVDTIKNKNQGNFFKKYYGKILFKNIDVFSCETREAYELILNNKFWRNDISSKLLYLPNGFDEEEIKKYHEEEKENIIITVGRLGEYQKNTEMLLESLEGLNLGKWKVLLIGAYDEKFKKKYIDFINRNKDKKDSVILVGSIENRKELYKIYSKSKCFILTSRYESFGIVLVEAARFGNYIITTDVGAAKDVTRNGVIGKIISSEDKLELKKEIKRVIEGQIDLKSKMKDGIEYCRRNFNWEDILRNSKLEERLLK